MATLYNPGLHKRYADEAGRCVLLICDGQPDERGRIYEIDGLDWPEVTLFIYQGMDRNQAPVGLANLSRDGDRIVADVELMGHWQNAYLWVAAAIEETRASGATEVVHKWTITHLGLSSEPAPDHRIPSLAALGASPAYR